MNKCLCDKCGAEFELTPHHKTEGDLDIVYIQCSYCNEEYLVSVTDSVLREAIEKYLDTMKQARTVVDAKTSDELARTARQMKAENHIRCKELIEKYKNG